MTASRSPVISTKRLSGSRMPIQIGQAVLSPQVLARLQTTKVLNTESTREKVIATISPPIFRPARYARSTVTRLRERSIANTHRSLRHGLGTSYCPLCLMFCADSRWQHTRNKSRLLHKAMALPTKVVGGLIRGESVSSSPAFKLPPWLAFEGLAPVRGCATCPAQSDVPPHHL